MSDAADPTPTDPHRPLDHDEDPMTETAADLAEAGVDLTPDPEADAEVEVVPGLGKAESLEQEGEVAADYLEGLLDLLDLDGDLDLDVEGDRAIVAIVGSGLETLVGGRGETLDALQELTRLAVQTKTGNRSRLMLDVAGYRAARREELTRIGVAAAERVASNGEPARLAPMTPFERKIVHDAVSGIEGVTTESEGEEPQRRVVILPSA
jgi:spoIIIJ-associated protein